MIVQTVREDGNRSSRAAMSCGIGRVILEIQVAYVALSFRRGFEIA